MQGGTTVFGRTSLSLRDGKRKVEVKVSWMPMESNLKLDNYADLEQVRLGNEFGKEYVGKPVMHKVGERAGYRISLDYGPGLLAAAYVFEAGPDAGKKQGNRWRVTLFALVPRDTAKAEFSAVEALLSAFKW